MRKLFNQIMELGMKANIVFDDGALQLHVYGDSSVTSYVIRYHIDEIEEDIEDAIQVFKEENDIKDA